MGLGSGPQEDSLHAPSYLSLHCLVQAKKQAHDGHTNSPSASPSIALGGALGFVSHLGQMSQELSTVPVLAVFKSYLSLM